MKIKKPKLRRKMHFILFAIIVLVLLGLFFAQQNTLAQQKSCLANYTQQLTEFSNQNENLETGFLEKNHLNNIEAVAKELNFERTQKIHYIRAIQGTVATK